MDPKLYQNSEGRKRSSSKSHLQGSGRLQFLPTPLLIPSLRYFDIQLDSAKSCTEGEELTKHSSFFPNIEIGFSFIHRYPFLIHTTLTLPNSVVILTGFLIAISIKIPVDHL